jgi:signal transduction histidine kinase
MHSPLVNSKQAVDQLRRQVNSVLDDVERYRDPAMADGIQAKRLGQEIGVARATHGVHPFESVRAAVEMFRVLHPVVRREIQSIDEEDLAVDDATVALHTSIMSRVGLGAIWYAGHLLKRVNSSHRDERTRIGRELHDRVAHAIGVAIQAMELHDFYAAKDPIRAARKLVSAQELMHDALAALRETSRELRDSVAEHGGLHKAMADYVGAHVPAGIEATVSVVGDADNVPWEVSEELYIVLREAVRNSVVHAGAQNIRVNIDGRGESTLATVEDDGRGFDTAQTSTGIGLLSMRERIDLLGGEMVITSSVGAGTAVSIAVPAPETS